MNGRPGFSFGFLGAGGRFPKARRGPEREFPALLVVWAYQQKQLFFLEEGSFFFARKRGGGKLGCFFRLLGCFCAFGVFLCFSRVSAAFFSSSSIAQQNPAHAVPLASARQHPENQKENQAGHSSERTVEGRSAAFFGGVNFSRPTTPKRGIPALAWAGFYCTIHHKHHENTVLCSSFVVLCYCGKKMSQKLRKHLQKASIYKRWLALKVMHDYVARMNHRTTAPLEGGGC